MKRPKLIPPDKEHCQKTILRGAWPTAEHFMEIGPREASTCGKKPVAIVYETKPGKDGRKGSMALCAPCLAECIDAFGGQIKIKML